MVMSKRMSMLDATGGLRGAAALYLALTGAQIRSQMQYKTAFVLEAAGSFLGNIAEFAAILIFFHRFASIGGWRVEEIALLYGLVAVPFALVHLVGQGFDEFQSHIRQGTFDQILTRPRTAFLQILAGRFQLRQLGRVAEAAVVFGLALVWLDAGARWGLGQWAFAAWSMTGGMLFFLGLMLFGATLCFWTVESVEAINIVTYGGSEMARYPMHIFAPWLRRVFVYLVPLAFVNYYPALVLLGKPDPLGLPPAAPYLAVPLCAAVFGASLLAWRAGVRHYVSTGS